MSLTIKEMKELFGDVQLRFPDGSEDRPLDVEVDKVALHVIFFPCEKNIVSFGLFFPQQEYSRKTILIHKAGFFSEDMVGTIPNSDLTEAEPDFSDVDNLEIIKIVKDKLRELK